MPELQKTDPQSVSKQIKPKGWKKTPSLLDLRQAFEDSKSAHDSQVTKIDRWLNYLHVRGEAAPKKVEGRSQIQPKLIRKQAEWRYSSLSEPFLAQDDLFQIEPRTWEDKAASLQNALVINQQINTRLDRQAFIDEYVRTAVDEGTVIIRTGWAFEEEDYTETVPTFEFRENPEMEPLMLELMELEEANPNEFFRTVPEELQNALEMFLEDQIPYEPVPVGTEEVTKTRTVYNHPTMEVVNTKNVVLDPSCGGNWRKAGFIGYTFETSLSELKKDGRYTNLDSIMVESESPLNQPDHDNDSPDDNTFNFKEKAQKRFVAFEYWGYWDINETGKLEPIVATWVGNTMIRLEKNPYPDKKPPFIFAQLLPVKQSAYGEPDGELLIDNQKIVGAVTRGMVDIMARSANGQVGSRKDALDAVNRRRFRAGLDYEYNGNVDPRMAFHMHTFEEIPASAQYLLQQQNMEAESMSGVKAFAQGMDSGALGDVVEGIKGVMDAAAKREAGILRRLAKGLIEAGRKIIAMNAEFLDEEEVVRITNEEFVTVRRDDLAGEFDLRMDIATAEEDNVKAQELSFMLQTMGNNMDQQIVYKILSQIARLRKMPALAKEFREYQPQPDPMEQQIKMLEVQKLQKEIEELDARAKENLTDADHNLAKIRKLNAESDQADLDFVEQESGTTQEREKELRGVQAAGNIELEREKSAGRERENRASKLDDYLSGKKVA